MNQTTFFEKPEPFQGGGDERGKMKREWVLDSDRGNTKIIKCGGMNRSMFVLLVHLASSTMLEYVC